MKPLNQRFKVNGFDKPTFEEFKEWYSDLSIPHKSRLEIATARDKQEGLNKSQVRQLGKTGGFYSSVTVKDIYERYVSHVLGF